MDRQKQVLVADRYRLQEQLPGNALVELYRAHDMQLDRPVTLQVLSAREARAASDFRRHQQIAATIHHQSVLAVYDAGDWDGQPYSVLERVGSTAAGPAPDLQSGLKMTRDASAGLQACRDAGLNDWTFSYEAVRIDPQGDARLALIEGLGSGADRQFASSRPETDLQALGALLRLALLGSPAASASQNGLPRSVASLLVRTSPGRGDSVTSAGQLASEIAALQAAYEQPTEAFLPFEAPPVAGAAAPAPYLGPPPEASSTDAPTLVAPVVPAPVAPVISDANHSQPEPADTATLPAGPSRPYTPPVGPSTADPRRRQLPVLFGLGAVVVLLLLVGALLGRPDKQGALLSGANAAAGSSSFKAAAPTTQSTVPAPVGTPVVSNDGVGPAPKLVGKSLEAARLVAKVNGYELASGDPVFDATYPAGVVARQDPAPGADLQPGSTITVNLSLGPGSGAQPAPTAAPAGLPGVMPTAISGVQGPNGWPGTSGNNGKKDGGFRPGDSGNGKNKKDK